MESAVSVKNKTDKLIALVGLESVGKSALFRHMTGHQTGIETNVKGSTVVLTRRGLKRNVEVELVDTPGIRFKDDSMTTKLTLEEIKFLEEVIIVVKSPHLKNDLLLLEEQLHLRGKKVTVIATHKDIYEPSDEEKHFVKDLLNVPVIWCNSRSMKETEQDELWEAIQDASTWKLNSSLLHFLPSDHEAENKNWLETVLRQKVIGPLFALLLIISMFASPVFLAYLFSSYVEPFSEKMMIVPLKEYAVHFPAFFQVLLIGDYGVLTLGWYSFLWAFPVVLFIGLSVAVTEETGIQEHITHALDPWLRKIGLTGRDLIPVLTGYGCNVVAVMQSRSCSSCTRASCISMISFGSACSYQIGATLSLFGSAGKPILFFPYILILFIVGAIHTRVWNKNSLPLTTVSSLPYLQSITWRGTVFRLKGMLKQFFTQAMPIFILICLVASIFDYLHVMKGLSALITPILGLFSLPADVAPGVIFSVFRKDGMMVLNEGQGSLLQSLETWQLFITVYLASTLSSCLVTLFTIYKELGGRHAVELLGKQMITSIISTLLLAIVLYTYFN